MAREWREPIAEFTIALSEGMRLCLALAEDLQEGGDESVEHVREQLLAMVRLEREVDHLQTAMQCVESTAASLQASEAPEDEPPNLMSDMESKMVSLLGEDVSFDPATHPCAQEFAQILTQGSEDVCEGEEEAMDKDVLVGKVQVSLKCPLTGCYLEDPVSNPRCGHTYSRGAVMRHIQCRAGSTGCPVCKGPLSASSLRPEPALAEKVRRAQRRRTRRPLDTVVTL